MDDLILEVKSFEKALENFQKKYGFLWSDTLPVNPTYLSSVGNTIDWARGELNNNINPDYNNIKINYSIGDGGFRVYPNYKPSNSKKVFTFGCSMTFGVAVPDEFTWPLLLAEKLGSWNVCNYGIPAASSWEIVRACYQTITSLKKEDYPDAIFLLFPDFFRAEYLGNNKTEPVKFPINIHAGKYPTKESFSSITPNNEQGALGHSKILAYFEYTSALHSFFEMVKAFKFIQEFLNSKNIPWFWYTWYPSMLGLNLDTINTYFCSNNAIVDDSGLKFIKRDKGRDNVHAGFKYNDVVAEEFSQLYKTYEINKFNNKQN